MLTTVHSAVEFPRMFSTTIFTNLDECRTECEIADNSSVVAVVYEERDGWRVNRLRSISEGAGQAFNTTIDEVKERLSHYINRFGEDVPDGLARAELSLWLMQKDDGTAMGMLISGAPGP